MSTNLVYDGIILADGLEAYGASLELDKIVIGATGAAVAGSIRYSGGNLQLYDGSSWGNISTAASYFTLLNGAIEAATSYYLASTKGINCSVYNAHATNEVMVFNAGKATGVSFGKYYAALSDSAYIAEAIGISEQNGIISGYSYHTGAGNSYGYTSYYESGIEYQTIRYTKAGTTLFLVTNVDTIGPRIASRVSINSGINTDVINELTSAAGVTISSVLKTDTITPTTRLSVNGGINTDVIHELSSGAGISFTSALKLDGITKATSGTAFTITIPSAPTLAYNIVCTSCTANYQFIGATATDGAVVGYGTDGTYGTFLDLGIVDTSTPYSIMQVYVGHVNIGRALYVTPIVSSLGTIGLKVYGQSYGLTETAVPFSINHGINDDNTTSLTWSEAYTVGDHTKITMKESFAMTGNNTTVEFGYATLSSADSGVTFPTGQVYINVNTYFSELVQSSSLLRQTNDSVYKTTAGPWLGITTETDSYVNSMSADRSKAVEFINNLSPKQYQMKSELYSMKKPILGFMADDVSNAQKKSFPGTDDAVKSINMNGISCKSLDLTILNPTMVLNLQDLNEKTEKLMYALDEAQKKIASLESMILKMKFSK
jgi:hypothetical protein